MESYIERYNLNEDNENSDTAVEDGTAIEDIPEIPAEITGADRVTVETGCETNPRLCQFYIEQYSKQRD
jgi:hypothetical protein